MKKIKILGRDCFIATLLAMTMWACDGTEDGHPDADACCDADVQPDQDPDGEAALTMLTVESTPVSGAAIEINGSDTGEITPANFELAVGVHTIQLTLADYDATPEEADLPAEGTTIVIELYPSVGGAWDLTYRNTETGGEGHFTVSFEQTGQLIIGFEDTCNYTGSISSAGYLSLYRDCDTFDRTVTGDLVSPSRLEGNWSDDSGSSGTWWADRR